MRHDEYNTNHTSLFGLFNCYNICISVNSFHELLKVKSKKEIRQPVTSFDPNAPRHETAPWAFWMISRHWSGLNASPLCQDILSIQLSYPIDGAPDLLIETTLQPRSNADLQIFRPTNPFPPNTFKDCYKKWRKLFYTYYDSLFQRCH